MYRTSLDITTELWDGMCLPDLEHARVSLYRVPIQGDTQQSSKHDTQQNRHTTVLNTAEILENTQSRQHNSDWIIHTAEICYLAMI
jgi:hypothetical protein